MGIVQSCLALIQVGKRKEAEELMQIYKMTKEINKESRDKANILFQNMYFLIFRHLFNKYITASMDENPPEHNSPSSPYHQPYYAPWVKCNNNFRWSNLKTTDDYFTYFGKMMLYFTISQILYNPEFVPQISLFEYDPLFFLLESCDSGGSIYDERYYDPGCGAATGTRGC